MANHLIIGLGGTGGKVLRELRKRVYEEFRSNEPGNGVYIDYIYVDSSPSDLEDKTGWKVMGQSVHLGSAQKVNINGISTSVLNNINLYPGLKGFLNPIDIQLMQQEMGALISAGIGGQRRRLGRTLIANNICDKNNTSNFEKVIKAAVGKLQQASGDNDVTFHICAGLAGGTGSGSIVDAIAQIRTWFPYNSVTKDFKMRLFLYTPEATLVDVKSDAGFYQANGYAALLELNALSTGHYHPTDVRGEKDIFTGEVQRLLQNQDAFDAAYIYTNVNEQGKVLDLGKGLPAAVADFIFQTTIASSYNNGVGQLNRLVGCENDGADPEINQAGEKVHSRKFLSFGITRVEFPEIEIRDYVTYTYVIQVALQMTYNLWQDGIGYGACTLDEVGTGLATEVADKGTWESLLISNKHLSLAKPIVETNDTAKWKDFITTWRNNIQPNAEDIMISKSDHKESWLHELDTRCDAFSDGGFRGQGVVKFYNIQQKEKKAYAAAIRRNIEKRLFDEWTSGAEKSKSILEIYKYTSLLKENCGKRLADFDAQIAKQEEEKNKYEQICNALKKEWGDKIKIFVKIFGAHKRFFITKYVPAKLEYCIAATRIVAYRYAKELLQEVILELNNMLMGINAFMDELSKINKEVEELANAKCKTNEESSDTDIKEYDPKNVRAICKQFICDKDKMPALSAEIRKKMVDGLGEDGEHTFANLYDKTDYETAVNIMLKTCQEHAIRHMEEEAQKNPLNKMVGVNIMEKLKTELNTDEKLEQFVKLVTQTSRSYVQFNPEESAMVIPGNTGRMMSMVQVSLPESSEKTDRFRQKLIDTFVKEIPGFDPRLDIAVNYKTNQIVVISANSGFPLRFLTNVKVCKEKYGALVSRQNSKHALNSMVLHTESFQEELPSLYEETPEEIKWKIIKPLMLAYALGIIAEQQNPVTQAKFEAISIPDETFGGEEWKPLGKGFVESWYALTQDFSLAKTLKEQVNKAMIELARSNEQKAVIRKNIGDVLKNKILPSSLCENNQFNSNYQRLSNLGKELVKEELQDL